MASASPATLPDSIRLNAPPLRSLLHFSSRSPSPEQSRDTHLHSPAVHSTRISHRHHCGRCDLYHVLFSSLLPSANSCHSFRLSLTFIHSFIGLCLSLPLFHDSVPSFRLQYRSSVDQTSCSQPAANFFVPFSTPERCHEPRLPPEPLRSFDLDPAQETRAKLYIYSFGPLKLVPCLADYFLTIITTSHRLRWTITFDSTRSSEPSKAVSIINFTNAATRGYQNVLDTFTGHFGHHNSQFGIPQTAAQKHPHSTAKESKTTESHTGPIAYARGRIQQKPHSHGCCKRENSTGNKHDRALRSDLVSEQVGPSAPGFRRVTYKTNTDGQR